MFLCYNDENFCSLLQKYLTETHILVQDRKKDRDFLNNIYSEIACASLTGNLPSCSSGASRLSCYYTCPHNSLNKTVIFRLQCLRDKDSVMSLLMLSTMRC